LYKIIPEDTDSRARIESSLAQFASDFPTRNPLQINVHPLYGGEIPKNIKYSASEEDQLRKEFRSNVENKYFVPAFFLKINTNPMHVGYGGGGSAVMFTHYYQGGPLNDRT
jgi:hypothetical protein